MGEDGALAAGTSCLQIAEGHSCGLSTVLRPRSQCGLTDPVMILGTGTAMARAESYTIMSCIAL